MKYGYIAIRVPEDEIIPIRLKIGDMIMKEGVKDFGHATFKSGSMLARILDSTLKSLTKSQKLHCL